MTPYRTHLTFTENNRVNRLMRRMKRGSWIDNRLSKLSIDDIGMGSIIRLLESKVEFTCLMEPVKTHTLHSETLTVAIDENGFATFNTP